MEGCGNMRLFRPNNLRIPVTQNAQEKRLKIKMFNYYKNCKKRHIGKLKSTKSVRLKTPTQAD